VTEVGDEPIVYALAVEDFTIIHTGLSQGYLSLTMRTNSSKKYSPVYKTSNTKIFEHFYFPWQPVLFPINIEFENKGDVEIKPIIIVTTFIRNFQIINLNNSGQKLKFTGLEPNETLEIDCSNGSIKSSLGDNTYRYNNMSQDSAFISMPVGVSALQCLGNFEFQIKYEMKYLL